MLLTDEEIEVSVKTGGVSWTGYRKDSHGFYTIPILSPYHYQFAKAIEAAVIEKLCAGVSMPEAAAYAGKTQAGKWKYTTGSIGSAKTWLLYQEREYLAKGLQIVPLYTADQLRAYGAAQRLKALEDAADIAEHINDGCVGAPDGPEDVAAAIRAMKGETP